MIELGPEALPMFFSLYECGVPGTNEWHRSAVEKSPGMESSLYHWLAKLSKES